MTLLSLLVLSAMVQSVAALSDTVIDLLIGFGLAVGASVIGAWCGLGRPCCCFGCCYRRRRRPLARDEERIRLPPRYANRNRRPSTQVSLAGLPVLVLTHRFRLSTPPHEQADENIQPQSSTADLTDAAVSIPRRSSSSATNALEHVSTPIPQDEADLSVLQIYWDQTRRVSGSVAATAIQRQFDEEDRRLRAQQATLQAQSQAAFKCIACDEDCPEDDIAPISGCSHKFCRDCLRNYVISKLKDKVHPTFCPVCAAATERVEPASGFIDDHLLQTIGLNDEQYEELREIQLSAQCIFLGCQRCNEPMYADRTEHETAMILVCPLQQCNHAWCKACQKTIADFDATAHACAGVLELESLMKDKGWKYCPVCRTPYEKKEGCNHMQCEPPCLAHFCYECGELIVRSAPAYETDEAINAHYRRCVKFDYPHVT